MKKIIFIFVIFVTLFFASMFFSNIFEKKKYNSLEKEYDIMNISNIYNTFTYPTPNIKNRAFIGNESAPIIIVVYIDPTKESSKYFLNTTYKFINDNYIQNAKVKLYGKVALSTGDYLQKNERFIYAKSAFCVYKINSSRYYPYYFDMINFNTSELAVLAEKHGINKKEFVSCYMNKTLDEIKEDSMEGERIKADVISPQMYVGIGRPKDLMFGLDNPDDLKKKLRALEISIGR